MASSETLTLASNGGVHPPDRLAAIAVSQISDLIYIDEKSISDDAVAARKALPLFQIATANTIEPYIDSIYAAEKSNVVENPLIKRTDPFDIQSYVTSATSDIISAADGTPFATPIQTHLAVFQPTVASILAQIFIDAANVQRSTSLDALGR